MDNNSRFIRRALGGILAAALALPALQAPAAAKPRPKPKAEPRVVVAVIDTGFNAFHEYFYKGGSLYGKSAPSSVTPAVLKEFGIDKDHVIKVPRTGSFGEDFAKVKARFDRIEEGESYWFAGTNVIGISFREDEQRLRPDGNASAHGIGTAASVLTANPEAIVVAVEDWSVDAAEEWAFTYPAVDIVTTSYGPATSYPTLNHLSFSYTGVVENGKVHFGAAANDPTYAGLDETSGPWWSIGIAGFEEAASGGRQVSSGQVPDFVGDFTQDLPYCRNCEEGTRSVGGTSFATPRSAGTFSKVLLETRRAAGHTGGIVKAGKTPLLVAGKMKLTNWDMRRALEEAAYYPTTADYGTEGGPDPTSVPVNDGAPWVQTGWGLISPERQYDVVKEMLAHLGVAGKPTRTKPQEACDFMTRNMEARRAYWEMLAVNGEGYGSAEDPYVYC